MVDDSRMREIEERQRRRAALIEGEHGPLSEETNPTRGEMRGFLGEAEADLGRAVAEVRRLRKIEAAARKVYFSGGQHLVNADEAARWRLLAQALAEKPTPPSGAS